MGGNKGERYRRTRNGVTLGVSTPGVHLRTGIEYRAFTWKLSKLRERPERPGTIQVPALVDGRSTDGGRGPSRLCLEKFDDTQSGHPLETVSVPTSLHHRPHGIRDFTMDRS